MLLLHVHSYPNAYSPTLYPQYFYWLPSLLHPLTSLVAPLHQYLHPHLHERVRKLYYISSSYISLWFSSANGVIHTLTVNTIYHTNLKGTGHQIIKHLFQINITYKLCV